MTTLITCIEIFLARLIDVTIGSIRTCFLVRQKNIIAALFAFIEILLWFLVSKKIFSPSGTNPYIIFSYALGYSFGTYFGGLINKFFLKGTLTAIIVSNKGLTIKNRLKKENFGVTSIKLDEDKTLLLVEFNKTNIRKLKSIIKNIDNSAFVIINETLSVENGYIN